MTERPDDSGGERRGRRSTGSRRPRPECIEGRGREETLHEMPDDTRFGAIAVWGGLVSPEALEETLAEQSAARASGKTAPRTGEMLVEKGLLTGEEVGRILRVQLQRLPAEGHLVFGRIAEAHRFITPGENRRALDVQSREMLAGARVRTLADILMDMGAIDREAADAVVSFQAKGDSTRMSKASRARLEGGPPGGPPGELEEGQLPATAPGNGGTPFRPVFLPRGALGFVVDHSTWLVIAAAALLAVVLIGFRERIFGARDEPGQLHVRARKAAAPAD